MKTAWGRNSTAGQTRKEEEATGNRRARRAGRVSELNNRTATDRESAVGGDAQAVQWRRYGQG
jgi:hypothetical protein